MKAGTESSQNRNIFRTALYVFLFWLASIAVSQGQENSASPKSGQGQESEPKQDYAIRIAVDEVRVDAVVLNWGGRQITDLTADDFVIYQDGRQQNIISCTYVNDYQPPSDPRVPPISAPAPSRDEIQRTILFLVDELGMGFKDFYHTRMALRNFVEKQMQPGDLVGILQTSRGYSRPFSSDKQQLLAIIEDIQWGRNQTIAGCDSYG